MTPVITTANSTEPGYAAQIPVAFGGSATPPGGQPDVAGPASANFDITPMLESGIDTNINLGNGVFGFQGDYSALTVTDDLAQTGSGRTRHRRRDARDPRRHRSRSGRACTSRTRASRSGARSTARARAATGGEPGDDTIVQAPSASSPAISIAATGLNAGNRLVLKRSADDRRDVERRDRDGGDSVRFPAHRSA